MTYLRIIFLLAFMTNPACAEETWSISKCVSPLVDEKRNSGLIVGVLQNSKMQYYPFGKVTTPEGNIAPNEKTIFEIGSITKAFTGTLFAIAIDKKEVALQEAANLYLPPQYQLKNKSTKPITLQHLATHRSGLPVQPPFLVLVTGSLTNPYLKYSPAKLQSLLQELKPDHEPEEKYHYSNLAVGLLGHALVYAAKVYDYQTLVNSRISQPLGLYDTTEALTGEQKARRALGHSDANTPTDPWEFATLSACGGLKSTASDLLRFAAISFGDIPHPLQKEIVESQQKLSDADSAKVEVGMCWHRSKLKNGTESVWHNGGTGGYRSMLVMTPKTKIAVVVLSSNAAVGNKVDRVAFEILTKLQP